jgi:hypothetical protein
MKMQRHRFTIDGKRQTVWSAIAKVSTGSSQRIVFLGKPVVGKDLWAAEWQNHHILRERHGNSMLLHIDRIDEELDGMVFCHKV